MERALYKRYGIGVVFSILAVIFIAFGIKNAVTEKEYAQAYVNTTAVITEKIPFPDGPAFVDIVYTDESGIERREKIEYYGFADVGDTINIKISANNSNLIYSSDGADVSNEQAEKKAKQKQYAVIEIICGAVMLVLGLFLIRRRVSSQQTSEENYELKAEIPAPKPTPIQNVKAETDGYDINEILKKADEKFPPLPAVALEPKRAENLSVFESKLGGVPYMPADHEYPKGKGGIFEGRPLRLLAQLNFEKLPHIDNFPKKGILQFFCSDDDDDCAYGINFNSPTKQNGFRIIYHENIIEDESLLMPKESMPEFTTDMGNFPFDGEFLLEAKRPESCCISSGDYRFNEAVFEIIGKISGRNIANFNDAEEAGFGDEFWEKLYDMRTVEQTCIGGYPFFTQDDPRGYKKEIADYGVLLFQCTSVFGDDPDDGIMWGDMGVANFFIKEEDLKKLDFSKTAYNWDCC